MFRSAGKTAQPFILPGLRTALETVKSLGSLVPVPFISSAVDVALNVITAIEVRQPYQPETVRWLHSLPIVGDPDQ